MIVKNLVLMIVLIGYGIAGKAYTDISFTENKLIFHTSNPDKILDMVEFYPKYVDLCLKQSNEIVNLNNRVEIYEKKEKNRDKIDKERSGIAKLSKNRRIIVYVVVIGAVILISYGGGFASGISISL